MIRHPSRIRRAFPVTVLLRLPVPCFPVERGSHSRVRVSPAVPQELYTIFQDFPRTGASGASQVLRRLSSCLPRPEDSGGPAQPGHIGCAHVAFGSVQTLGVRNCHVEAVPALQGCAVTPTASRILCLRFAHLVRRYTSRLRHGRKTRYGWVARPYPTGTFTLQETPSLLGAITPGMSRALPRVGSMPLFGQGHAADHGPASSLTSQFLSLVLLC